MHEQLGRTDEPLPPEEPTPSEDEREGLNSEGAGAGLSEPNSFEPEEG
jgi:hypothetical protein